MPSVTIYTTPWCPYCKTAKSLLDRKSVAYDEIDVDGKPDLRQAMTRAPADAPRCRRSSSARRMSAAPTTIHALDARANSTGC